MNSEVWKYEGKFFDQTDLSYLKNTFSESYSEIIKRFSNDPFVCVIEKNLIEKKSFGEFDQDVKSVVVNVLKRIDAKVVVTLAGNSYQHCVFIFAILLAGKTLFPINPNEPLAHIRDQLSKLSDSYIVFSEDETIKTQFENSKLMEIPFSNISECHFSPTKREDDFIYILTSGSTGRSKIVRQTQFGVIANAEALIRHHRLSERKTIGTALPIFHVNCLHFSFFASFFSGGKFVLWRHFNIINLGNEFDELKIQIYSAIPEIIRSLVKQAKQFQGKINNLDYFVSAAAPLSVELVKAVKEKFERRIVQGYGLSEAINFSSLIPLDLNSIVYEKVMTEFAYPSIGVELWGNHVFIVNEIGEKLEDDQVGEIVVQGYVVMKGYLNDSEVQNFFRTGDLGFQKTIDSKKFLFITGRLKDVAKRSGETIPLRDVDDYFLRLDEVIEDCIVVAFKHESRGQEIGLVVRLNQKIPSDWKSTLENYVEQLPLHWRPKVVYFCNSISMRTASGKPRRWVFSELFSDYSLTGFGQKTIWNYEPIFLSERI